MLCTYLAHHELESLNIVVIINILREYRFVFPHHADASHCICLSCVRNAKALPCHRAAMPMHVAVKHANAHA